MVKTKFLNHKCHIAVEVRVSCLGLGVMGRKWDLLRVRNKVDKTFLREFSLLDS